MVSGSVYGENFKNYSLEFGQGLKPEKWTQLINSQNQIRNNIIYRGNIDQLPEGLVTLRLTAENSINQKFQDKIYIIIIKNLHSNFPIKIGQPSYVRASFNLADLNNDGKKEIIDTAIDQKDENNVISYIYAIQEDGSNLSGWPVKISDQILRNTAIGDVNGDGKLEVIISYIEDSKYSQSLGKSNEEEGLYIISSQGQILKKNIINNEEELAAEGLSIGDVNNNGKAEIIIKTYMYDDYSNESQSIIHIEDENGEELPGWPKISINDFWGHISLGDMNNDGSLEVITSKSSSDIGNDGQSTIFVFQENGDIMPGWPKNIQGWGINLILADINKDNNIEVIYAVLKENESRNIVSSYLYVIGNNSQIFKGWPRLIESSGVSGFVDSLSVGNIDSDQNLEILVGGELYGQLIDDRRDSTIIAYNDTGEIVNSWPQVKVDWLPSELILADINEDREDDLLIGHIITHQVDAFLSNGSFFWSKPIDLFPLINNTDIAVDDIDGDGKIELIYSRPEGVIWVTEFLFPYPEYKEIYVWDLNVAGNVSWPMYRHDAQRTGNYNITSTPVLVVDPDKSTISVDKDSINPSGEDYVTATVTLKDKNENPIPNREVSLTSSRRDKDKIELIDTNKSNTKGEVKFKISSLVMGNAELIAKSGDVTLSFKAEINFISTFAVIHEPVTQAKYRTPFKISTKIQSPSPLTRATLYYKYYVQKSLLGIKYWVTEKTTVNLEKSGDEYSYTIPAEHIKRLGDNRIYYGINVTNKDAESTVNGYYWVKIVPSLEISPSVIESTRIDRPIQISANATCSSSSAKRVQLYYYYYEKSWFGWYRNRAIIEMTKSNDQYVATIPAEHNRVLGNKKIRYWMWAYSNDGQKVKTDINIVNVIE